MSCKRVAFTLMELVVAVAIFGVTIALRIPAVQRAREAAARAESSNNLRQVILVASFPDGTSNTIALAEHYQNCRSTSFSLTHPFYVTHTLRRAAFADQGDAWSPSPLPSVAPDNRPIISGNPPRTDGLLPGAFQAAPAIKDCDPRYPQSPHHAGMNIAMVDGSVRFIGAKIGSRVFWSAVTSAGREVGTNDW
ncbi:MAG: DUF1559 domain-containing protein [Gemmataceae bacterium]|nr:DUF1559 domain-containing protein [Gemmataceae bacterium]